MQDRKNYSLSIEKLENKEKPKEKKTFDIKFNNVFFYF